MTASPAPSEPTNSGGQTDLAAMLAGLTVSVRPGRFTLAANANGDGLGDGLHGLIAEDEGVTAVIEVEAARAAGLDVGFEAAWLTLDVHSALEAVGLTAAVSDVLAQRGLPCNVIAAHFHDHLLVPADRVDEAIAALAELRNPPQAAVAGPKDDTSESVFAAVTVGNLITDGTGFVLVRETKAVARGRWSPPAGRLERGESMAAGAEREALEETGLVVRATDLVGLYHCPSTSEGGAAVQAIFLSAIEGGAITTSTEHPDVRFFTREEIDQLAEQGLLRGQHVRRAIADHDAGVRLPLDLITEVGPAPFPEGLSG